MYVYGSVATGLARAPGSDVDVLTIGLPTERAVAIGEEMSAAFADLCRGVEIAAADESDFEGEGDGAYGGRVFLHHYCVHLAGPDLDRATSPFPGDRRAARAFNGDIAQHMARWHRELDHVDPAHLGRRVARKTLLAVAGLVSVHDGGWTTDRERSVRRWQQVRPELADGLEELLGWASGQGTATTQSLEDRLKTTVHQIVHQFAADVGLWQT